MASKQEIWIISGESSGDLYGAKIATELKRLKPGITIAGMGGVEMRRAGVELLVDSSDLGVIGVVEILENIFKFIRLFFNLCSEAKKRRPACVVLVDYPGFNIRFAKQMWKAGIPVVWYISPQVWAWRKGNIKKLAKYCSKMLVIFPFEPEVYQGSGLDVEFVGHPLVDIVHNRADATITRDPNSILLLPGSRNKEIRFLLDPFLQTAILLKKQNSELKFTISAPRNSIMDLIKAEIEKFKKEHPDLPLPELTLSVGKTAFWMQRCSTGLAASGTVTVECAIAGIPLVVAYKLNEITFQLARLFIRKLFRGFFTMVNIILYKNVFHEFLQFQVVPETLEKEMRLIMPGGDRRAEVEADMQAMTEALSVGASSALSKTAQSILKVAFPKEASKN